MLVSIVESKWRQYDSALKKWWEFCKENNYNPMEVSVSLALQFLTFWFNKGARHGTLNSARSALALLAPPGFAEEPQMRRFFKGIYKLRPSAPKYDLTWDPAIVLNYLRSLGPNDGLSLDSLASKLATLLALTTAHRIQTLSLIQVRNMEYEQDGILIKIPLPIKTSRKGVTQPSLFLPYFNEEPTLCLASALNQYMLITSALRSSETDRLFISSRKPHGEASSQTLSRWIHRLLTSSGLDTSKFSAYSTRHAAVSKAHRSGVSMDIIRRTAGWLQVSDTFACFYNRPCVPVPRGQVALAVLR